MNTEIRKFITLILTVFIIVSAFIPVLSPLPQINNSTSEYSLVETFANTLNKSNSSPVAKWFNQLGLEFVSNYASDYLMFLDIILFGVLGVLLIMLLIGVIMAIMSKNNGGGFIRVIAVLNTLTYAGLILLTIYQANKLNNDSYGFSTYFIKITPSIGAWIGLITSFVLIIISGYGRSKTVMAQFQNSQNIMTPPQASYTHSTLSENSYTQTPPTTNIQQQSGFQAHSANDSVSTRLGNSQSQDEIEVARLGNGYMSKAVEAGTSKSTGVTLTDKRLYLSGKLYKGKLGGKLKKNKSTCTVDLQDIMGMEFKRHKKNSILITAIILFVLSGISLASGGFHIIVALLNLMLFVVSIVMFINYFNTGVTLFIINSRNGSVGFDVHFAGQTTVERFAESIQSVKDTYNN